MILLIDNYDSFAHNLARYLRQLGHPVRVARNDQLSVDDVQSLNPDGIVLSPGPCTPREAGICLDLVSQCWATIPILGVCLGHQAICQALGATLVRTAPVHGTASLVAHNGHPLFESVPSPFLAGRYHSLAVEERSLPAELQVVARLHPGPQGANDRTFDAVVMSVCHREAPLFGVQFHPESILSPYGYQLLANFLNLAGLPVERPGDLTAPATAQLPVPGVICDSGRAVPDVCLPDGDD